MKKISYIDMIIDKQTNYDESTDVIVSDALPDISRIISVNAVACIKDTSVQNDRVLISGDITGEVCYIPEDSTKPVKMNISMNFAHIEDASIADALIYSSIDINKIEARIINPRKISVLSNVCIFTKAYNKSDIKIPKCNDFGCEILENKKQINLIDSVNINEFVISDNVQFKGLLADEFDVFGMRHNIVVTDTKALKNKIMIRGNVEFLTGVIMENEVLETTATVPFSQIIDISITDESLDTHLDFSVKNFDAEHIADGEFSFSMTVKALVIQKRDENITLVEDIYDVSNELIVKDDNISLRNCPVHEFLKHDFNVNVQTDNIADSVVSANAYIYAQKNADKTLDFVCNVFGVYKSGAEYYAFKESFVFEKNVSCTSAEFKNISITKSVSGNIDIRVMCDSYKYKNEKISFNVIDTVEKANEKESLSNTIILKYIPNKTDIWDIAKEYNTTVADIKSSNAIDDGNTTVENKMLLIPVK